MVLDGVEEHDGKEWKPEEIVTKLRQVDVLVVDGVFGLMRPFFSRSFEMEVFGDAMTVAPDLHPPFAFVLHNRANGTSLRLVFDLALAPWCKSGAPQSATPENWRNVRRTNGCKQLHPGA